MPSRSMAPARQVGSDVERSYAKSDLLQKRHGDGPRGGVRDVANVWTLTLVCRVHLRVASDAEPAVTVSPRARADSRPIFRAPPRPGPSRIVQDRELKRMLRHHVQVVCVAVSITTSAHATNEVLSNDDVLQLVSMGVAEEAIIAKIRSTSTSFVTTVDSMIALPIAGSGPWSSRQWLPLPER